MLIVSDTTIANRAALETRGLPKRFFGRVQLWPRRAVAGLRLRLIVEIQILRYLGALLPFLSLAFIWRDLALPISQAPLVMLLIIAGVELKVLRLSARERRRVVDADVAARHLDTLSFRAKACLRKIAARRGLAEGALHLVVEQSELARIAPLTLVSVQSDQPAPHLLTLDEAERRILQEGLFDAELTEAALLAANHREDRYLRDIVQETGAVSAHTRLQAAIERRRAAS